MNSRTANIGPQALENLENRVLFSTISPSNFGAHPNDGGDDRPGVQAAINAANPGDTIVFSDGTYNFNGQLKIKSGITLTAANPRNTTLDFNVQTMSGYTNDNDFALRAYGIRDFTMSNLKVRSNNGVVMLDGGTSNCKFTGNDFVWGYSGNYYNRLAFYSSYTNDGLMIEHNYFHDSPNSDRNVELWGLKNSSYSYNRFYKVTDGGHIQEPISNVKLSYNVGEKIHRMGMEVQGTNQTTGLYVQGNVFTNWDRPYNDTFGMSVMMVNSPDTHILNNYLRTDFSGDWGYTPGGMGGPRFGLAIEAGLAGGELSGNVIGGPNPWAAGVAASDVNTLVKNGGFYGHAIWYDTMGQGGPRGNGSVIEQNNYHTNDRSQMPSLPDTSFAGPQGGTPSGDGGTGGSGGGTGGGTGGTGGGTAGYISDMNYNVVANGWGPAEKDRSNGEQAAGDGSRLTIGGKGYDKGLGVHAGSTITLDLGKKYTTFFSDVGIDDEEGSAGSAGFQVWGDGNLLFDSGARYGSQSAMSIQVNVANVSELKLVVNTGGDNYYNDHADWAGL